MMADHFEEEYWANGPLLWWALLSSSSLVLAFFSTENRSGISKIVYKEKKKSTGKWTGTAHLKNSCNHFVQEHILLQTEHFVFEPCECQRCKGFDILWKPSWTWWTQTWKKHTSYKLFENLFSHSNHHKMIHNSQTHQKVRSFFPQRGTANT